MLEMVHMVKDRQHGDTVYLSLAVALLWTSRFGNFCVDDSNNSSSNAELHAQARGLIIMHAQRARESGIYSYND